jgi:predicted DNA-binding transcriptional regulator YafY
MIPVKADGKSMQFLILALALFAAACVVTWRLKVHGRAREADSLMTEAAVGPSKRKPRSPTLVTIAEKINRPLTIRYRDAKGVETERPVTVLKVVGRIDGDGVSRPTRFFAFCEARNDVRTFLFERVLEATDGETGEVVGDLAGHLIQSVPASAATAR